MSETTFDLFWNDINNGLRKNSAEQGQKQGSELQSCWQNWDEGRWSSVSGSNSEEQTTVGFWTYFGGRAWENLLMFSLCSGIKPKFLEEHGRMKLPWTNMGNTTERTGLKKGNFKNQLYTCLPLLICFCLKPLTTNWFLCK